MLSQEIDPRPPTLDPLTWSVRLYEADPGKRYIVFLCAIGAALVGVVVFQNPFFALLGLVAILAPTAEYWLPLNYKLDKKRASVRCGFSVTAIEWTDVRRVVMAGDGWKLSPHIKEARTSPFRGVYLRFPRPTLDGEPEPIQDYVRTHVNEDARYVELGADGGGGGETPAQGSSGNQEAKNGSARDPGPGGP